MSDKKKPGQSDAIGVISLRIPVVSVGMLLVALFFFEAVLMALLATLELSPALAVVLDALGITVVMAPLIYVLVFRPLIISLRAAQRAENDESLSANQYRRLIEFSPYGILVLNNDVIEFANTEAMTIIGAASTVEIVDHSIVDAFSPECIESLRKCLVASMKGYAITPGMNLDIIKRDGTKAHVEMTIIPMVITKGTRVFMLLADVTERRNSELALVSSRESFESIILQSMIGYLIVDWQGIIAFVNEEAAVMLKAERSTLLDTPFQFPIMMGGTRELEIAMKSGGQGLAEMRFSSTRWKNEPATLVVLHDITRSSNLQKELRALSVLDELTELHNRRGFLELAQHQLKRARRSGVGVSVLFIDLDKMKWINDNLGHEYGDSALKEISNILKDTFRESDIIGRMGGDEFAVMVIGASDDSGNSLVESVRKNVEIVNAQENRKYALECSIGYMRYRPEEHSSVQELIAAADDLMYREKQARDATRNALIKGPT